MPKRVGYRIPFGTICMFDRTGLHWQLIDGVWTTDEGGTAITLELRKYSGPFTRCSEKHEEVME